MALGQKVCSIARTDRQTHRQTHTKVTTVGTLSGFQDFFLQPVIKDWPNMNVIQHCDHHDLSATGSHALYSLLF